MFPVAWLIKAYHYRPAVIVWIEHGLYPHCSDDKLSVFNLNCGNLKSFHCKVQVNTLSSIAIFSYLQLPLTTTFWKNSYFYGFLDLHVLLRVYNFRCFAENVLKQCCFPRKMFLILLSTFLWTLVSCVSSHSRFSRFWLDVRDTDRKMYREWRRVAKTEAIVSQREAGEPRPHNTAASAFSVRSLQNPLVDK